ncbi:MAG: FecR domain-containing protein [Oscillospiraceae bacterium]|nr:FecR domain-containing protein [Oscillospiraceae bacterium]
MTRKNNSVFLLFLVFVLLLPACGSKETAATMHLVRAEGAVSVNDTDGASVALIENLGLYSGYGVATQAASYGWIDLDEAKLAKMDEDSEVEIVKSDKLLELCVQSGGLFFNVTEPLTEDETMNIRTSTMLVGIRGTCGWVYVEDDSLMHVYLLRGKVECSVLGGDSNALASEMLTAGQVARMTLSEGTASIVVEDFSEQDIPAFVMTEIEEDTAMIEPLQPEEPEVTEPPETAPIDEEPAPADEEPAPEDEEPALADEEPAPADEEPTPVDEEPAPADEEPAPTEEEPVPAEEDAGQTSNSVILEQYKAILEQGKSYTYNSDAARLGEKSYERYVTHTYALYQESGFSAPTLILRQGGMDRHGYLLFRYDADTGTTSQVGEDTVTRFEMPSHSFINDVGWDNWHDLTDTSYLESWLS